MLNIRFAAAWIYGWLLWGTLLSVGLVRGAEDGPTGLPVNRFSSAGQLWITSGKSGERLAPLPLRAGPAETPGPEIVVQPEEAFQSIVGFGYTLTGGSAQLLAQLPADVRRELLTELFAPPGQGLGINVLRLSIGASDLDAEVFSYADAPANHAAPSFAHFSLAQDREALLPILKEIVAICPEVHLIATPWSPPLWMKTNGNSIGGELKPEHYADFAQYLVKYLQQMQREGFQIAAISLQNEPENGTNNPSMLMSAAQQAELIKSHVGPALRQANLTPQILIWDHNCDRPEYPLAILNDPEAKAWVHGTAFHLYAGSPDAFAQLHAAHPDRALYFTEQWTELGGDFGGDLRWHLKNVMIGTLRNWNSAVLEWNLASDPQGRPFTPGGCSRCQGALTIDHGKITRNVSYYVIAHAARFLPRGSVRIASTLPAELPNVAFRTPEKSLVVLMLNDLDRAQSVTIRLPNQVLSVELPAQSVGTLVW